MTLLLITQSRGYERDSLLIVFAPLYEEMIFMHFTAVQ